MKIVRLFVRDKLWWNIEISGILVTLWKRMSNKPTIYRFLEIEKESQPGF